MIRFTMKIETEDGIFFWNVLAKNPRQAIELTAKNLFWIVEPDEQVFSITVDKIGGLPALIKIPNFKFPANSLAA